MDHTEIRLSRQPPLHEQVYEVIWRAIQSGEIAPGGRLRDTDWAARLGISRTPVREALRKLAHDGVLLSLDSGGYQLRRPGRRDIIDLYECRAVLEGLAAARAATRATADDLATLEQLLDETQKALDVPDLARVYDRNGEFHRRLCAVAGNEPLQHTLAQLTRRVEFARTTLLRSAAGGPTQEPYVASLRQDLAEHRELLTALTAGDATRAEHIARTHIERTAREQAAMIADGLEST